MKRLFIALLFCAAPAIAQQPILVGAAMPSPNGHGNGRVPAPPELPERPDIDPA